MDTDDTFDTMEAEREEEIEGITLLFEDEGIDATGTGDGLVAVLVEPPELLRTIFLSLLLLLLLLPLLILAAACKAAKVGFGLSRAEGRIPFSFSHESRSATRCFSAATIPPLLLLFTAADEDVRTIPPPMFDEGEGSREDGLDEPRTLLLGASNFALRDAS